MKSFKLEIGKIVGASNENCWSQVHAFTPGKKEKREKWGDLLAVFALKSKKEGVEVSSFGKEIIQRFHETYYSSSKESILDNLTKAGETITAEFKDMVVIQVVAAVVIDGERPVFYSVARGGEVRLSRQEKIARLLVAEKESKSVSGYLKEEDVIVLGTSQFFDKVSKKSLQQVLKKKYFDQMKDDLSALVGSQENNSLMAAVIVSLPGGEKKEKEIVASETVKPKQKFLGRIFGKAISLLPKIELPAYENLQVFLKKRSQIGPKNRKTQLTVAIVLIILLFLSVFLGFRKRFFSTQLQKEEQIIQEVSLQLDQAKSLAQASPAKAEELLSQAKGLISDYQAESEKQYKEEELTKLLSKIEDELRKVTKEESVEANLFLDLSLIKEGFSGENWDLSGTRVVILDKKNNSVLRVDLENKQGKIVAGGGELNGAVVVAGNPGFSFVYTKDELFMIDQEEGKILDNKEVKKLGSIKDMVGFAGNVYLLGKSQIYKFVGLDEGLADERDYLEKESSDLDEAAFLSIDGSIWVLTDSGQILKFIRGIRDHFVTIGLDQDFEEPKGFFTNEESENLYVLDQKNTRVVVINKEDGQYKTSYLWSGIAGVQDLAVLEEENKIFLLTGPRIYEIEMK